MLLQVAGGVSGVGKKKILQVWITLRVMVVNWFWFPFILKFCHVSGQLHTGGVGFRGGIWHGLLHPGWDEGEYDKHHQTGNSPEITWASGNYLKQLWEWHMYLHVVNPQTNVEST